MRDQARARVHKAIGIADKLLSCADGYEVKRGLFEELRNAIEDLATSVALQMVAAERKRQVAKGYDAKHDDGHQEMEMVCAAIAFLKAAYAHDSFQEDASDMWPWEEGAPVVERHDNGTDNLVKAAAMIVAEIERRHRAADKSGDL